MTLWDTGGQERHDSLTANYYRNAHAVIFVYALDDENSLYALGEWMREAMDLNRHGEHLVLALWGTKADQPSNHWSVRKEAVEALVKCYNIPRKLICSVSVLDNTMDDAMLGLMEYLDGQLNAHSVVVDPDVRDLSKLMNDADNLSGRTRLHRRCCKH